MDKNKFIEILDKKCYKTLENYLEKEPSFEFLIKEGLTFFGVKSNPSSDLYKLSSSSIHNYNERYGAEKTYGDIVKFLACNAIPGQFIFAMNGISLNKSININKNTILAPYSEIPDSFQKAIYMPSSTSKDFWCQNIAYLEMMKGKENIHSKFNQEGYLKPTIALIQFLELPKNQWLSTDDFNQIYEPLHDICRLLCFLGPSAASRQVAFWWQPEPWLHCWPNVGNGRSLANFDLINTKQIDLKIEDVPLSFIDLCNNFTLLNEKTKSKLRVPLDRINNAILRKNIIDQSIELGIAIESLLINDGSSKTGELSYRIALRAAFLLGTNGDERKEIFELFKALYDYRSSSVHKGEIEKKIKAKEDLQKGILYTTDAIKKLIYLYREKRVDKEFWDNLILQKEC